MSHCTSTLRPLDFTDQFSSRHNGPRCNDVKEMLAVCGYDSFDELIDATIPTAIRDKHSLGIGKGMSEHEALEALLNMSRENRMWTSFIGQGYYGTITPPTILRNIVQNPLWYTPYTPYQAEISQGRLEALLNFQQMTTDLTGMEVAGASLLDEATAAGEAAAMCFGNGSRKVFVASTKTFPQTLAVLKTRCEGVGIELRLEDNIFEAEIDKTVCGVMIQNPDSDGNVFKLQKLADKAHEAGALLVVATDLMALTLIASPGSQGADIVLGSSQRFGVPMGYGGPHAAFFATHQKLLRRMPGRVIGVSKDAQGNQALRMTLQTREQHIRREKATSNICTAQALLAVCAGFYAVYHGPKGLRKIGNRIHAMTDAAAAGLKALGLEIVNKKWFDTLLVACPDASKIHTSVTAHQINLRHVDATHFGISIDETTSREELFNLLEAIAEALDQACPVQNAEELDSYAQKNYSNITSREVDYLTHPVFNLHHSETDLLRYANRLVAKDYSLVHGMIPLGSCTMKLNAASEMIPITFSGFANLHPFVPADQAKGYHRLLADLETWLSNITGFDAISMQPNSGANGEYAGLSTIRAFFKDNGQDQRDVCLIPTSAHGTNPASAAVAGMKIVAVNCKDDGELDLEHLKDQAEAHRDNLCCLMITYPSTFGVFEDTVTEACRIIHEAGGKVYMDGANMNAQVGFTSPGYIGADVCHLNLHKTFAIPHGGGGPGMGPIGVTSELAPYLPGHPLNSSCGGAKSCGTVSAAPYGSAMILPIVWAYIRMMGDEGLVKATRMAILNANYLMARLKNDYKFAFTGKNNTVAHEFILDVREFQKDGITVDDIAKRLMDFGFHGPTMSWPVPGTLMFEPTESEPKSELDRIAEAMLTIREEVRNVISGKWPTGDNPLHNAPHTAEYCLSDNWNHAYSRETAAYPVPSLRSFKFWPAVARVDNVFGDRNLMCSCPSVSEMACATNDN